MSSRVLKKNRGIVSHSPAHAKTPPRRGATNAPRVRCKTIPNLAPFIPKQKQQNKTSPPCFHPAGPLHHAFW